jgi:hypothetical protein
MAEVANLFAALQILTEQVKVMAERNGGGSGKKWDNPERYKNLKVYAGEVKEFEEWSVKFRSLVSAGDAKVGQLMKAVEHDCTEEELVKNKYSQTSPEFDENDEGFIIQTAAEMYNLLLNITTGEANAVVRRSLGSGWLAWKRLTSSLNPRTLASGIKAISAVLNPPKVSQAAKADQVLDEWEDKMVKLQVEYGQMITSKMKVAVLYAMMPKDLQEKVLDACAVNWDETSEQDAGQLYTKVKAQLKNVAKARREMQGPKPMEVDRVSSQWADWSVDEWADQWGESETKGEEHVNEAPGEEAYVQYIGKGDGKSKGKGFQGNCYVCGGFGHTQWECPKGKGKGKGFGKDPYIKGGGKYNLKGGYMYKGYDKGYGKGKDNWYGKGKGSDYGKGGPVMQRACFGCGSTEHLLKDCPKNPSKVNHVSQEEPEEILFIGNVKEEWKNIPMKIGVLGRMDVRGPSVPRVVHPNRFRVLQVDEPDDEAFTQVFAVDVEEHEPTWEIKRDQVKGGKAGEGNRTTARAPEVSTATTEGAGKPCAAAGWLGRSVPQLSTRAEADITECGDISEGLKVLREEVQYVQAVQKESGMLNLGKGDIVVDSAADESCWPVGHGDAFPTKPTSRELKLRTANGGDMKHYGEKHVTFKYKGGEANDPVGLKFQVTDVKKPLLAVRRLVEKGNVVVLSSVEGESYIYNKEANMKIPIVKKGGSFVIEADFVQGFTRRA